MSYVRVWIHAVWGTKNHAPVLTKEIRRQVVDHIRENARNKGISVEQINGSTEHIHCLFGLDADMTIAKSLQLMKGESAYWINRDRVTRAKFEWADEYYAVSVSESALPSVRVYIDNQDAHHAKAPFGEEVAAFLREHNFAGQG